MSKLGPPPAPSVAGVGGSLRAETVPLRLCIRHGAVAGMRQTCYKCRINVQKD